VELGIKSQLKRYTDAYKNKALIQKIGFVNGVVFTYSNGCVATYSFVSSPAPRDGMCSTSTLKGSLSCPAAIPTADVDSEQ
ncbi:MAG: hypothetical protein NT027_17575, partial [Proteobacteria bacterium]|nr:hypothetical protein [Pseudomonadota bacterium]